MLARKHSAERASSVRQVLPLDDRVFDVSGLNLIGHDDRRLTAVTNAKLVDVTTNHARSPRRREGEAVRF